MQAGTGRRCQDANRFWKRGEIRAAAVAGSSHQQHSLKPEEVQTAPHLLKPSWQAESNKGSFFTLYMIL